jgi:DNA-binding NarL/FixJ family response regulator
MGRHRSGHPVRRHRLLRILIVDPHPVLREGLRYAIEHTKDLAVCAEAESAPQAMNKIRESNPDVVVTSLRLRDSNGIDLVKAMRSRIPSGIPTLMLSMKLDPVFAQQAIRAGAQGYVTKDEPMTTVLEALHRIVSGGTYISSKIAGRLAPANAEH